MKLFNVVFCSVCLLAAVGAVRADDDIFANEGVQSFQQDKDAWRRDVEEQKEEKTVLPEIRNAIGEDALNNIENAEQAFCYEVANKPDDYTGYMLNGMAVTGFCGVLNDELKKMVLNDLFMTRKNILFDVQEDCVIHPKVMLRFIRGVDSVDVLLSAPCYSFAVFYAGKVNVFNAKTASKVLDTLVSSFQKNRVDFVSPAILGQLLPVGVPQTPEQKALVSNTPKPIRNWDKNAPKEEAKKDNKSSGWNNLNF